MNIYLNQEAPQVEPEPRIKVGPMFFRGEPPPGVSAPVGCWRVIDEDYIDPVDPDSILTGLVGYTPPVGTYIVASWTEPDDEHVERRLVYWLVWKGSQRIKFYKFDETPESVLAAVKAGYKKGMEGITLYCELLT